MFCSTMTTVVPLAIDLHQAIHHIVDDDRREAGRGLVEKQDRRLGHQRHAQRQDLLLSAGQRAGDLAAALLAGSGNSR